MPSNFVSDVTSTGLYCAMTSNNGGGGGIGNVTSPTETAAAVYHGYDSGHSTSHSPNDEAIANSGKASVLSREAADKLGEFGFGTSDMRLMKRYAA